MFDKFGEFNSYEELNMAAEGLKNEGDKKSLYILAKENGIDKEDVDDYIEGMIPELATVYSAAFGRLEILYEEEIEKKKSVFDQMPLKIIYDMTKSMCNGEEFAHAVMKKGKRIEKIYKLMKKKAGEHKKGNAGVSCGTDRQLRDIIRAYFVKNEKECTSVLEGLYR